MNERASLPRRSILALVVILLCGNLPTVPAEAAPVAATQQTVAATVGSWSAVAVAPGAPAALTPFTLPWTTTGNEATSYLEIVNIGTLRLDSQTLVLTVTVTRGGATTDPVVLTACRGASWDVATGSCTGTAQSVGSSQQSPLATSITIDPGGRLSIRAATTRTTASRTTTTVDVRVARIDARPATVTSG
jgi:hypothetical protein